MCFSLSMGQSAENDRTVCCWQQLRVPCCDCTTVKRAGEYQSLANLLMYQNPLRFSARCYDTYKNSEETAFVTQVDQSVGPIR